jgi:hypothetical protein
MNTELTGNCLPQPVRTTTAQNGALSPRSRLEEFASQPGRQLVKEGKPGGPFQVGDWVVGSLAVVLTDRSTEEPERAYGVEISYSGPGPNAPEQTFEVDLDECNGLINTLEAAETLAHDLEIEAGPYIEVSFLTRSGARLGLFHSTTNNGTLRYAFVHPAQAEQVSCCDLQMLVEIRRHLGTAARWLERKASA